MKRMMKKVYVRSRIIMLVMAFILTTVSAFSQSVTVKGRVTDNYGETMPGVAVFVKGNTTTGTITDLNGDYSISISQPENSVLVFSFIGFKIQEIPVGSQQTINVVLAEDIKQLDDVVVVGYGMQKKQSVVGSITQARGEELLKAGSVSTISEALTGLLPGVTTMQAAGQPGSTAANILIRGRGTWENSTPLFLVDGVERDFNELDPNEIESISVLKDASATAVFGVDGAEGVILITTKSGSKGKAKVSFSSNVGIKSPTIDENYTADYATNLEHLNMALINDGKYSKLRPQFYIDRWRDPAYADNPFYQYTSFVDELFGKGFTQQYNLNISGGTEKVRYFTSFGYHYDGDIFDLEKQPEFDPRTYQHRFNWRTNLDFTLTKSTVFSVKLSGDMTNWNGNHNTQGTNDGVTGTGGQMMGRIYSGALINAPAVYDDGKLGYDDNNSINVNYLALMERESSYKKRKNRLYTDFILKQEITKHLNIQGKFSYNYAREYKHSIAKLWDNAPIYYYIPSADGYNPDLDEDGNIIRKPKKLDDWENPASVSDEEIDAYNRDFYYEGSINYARIFGNHEVTALGLVQRRDYKNKTSFPSLKESWVGRLTYAYKDKYLFETSGSYMGNENFNPDDRFGFFPSVAVGWVLSEESIIRDRISFIDFLKVRYSYGQVGSASALKGENRWLYYGIWEMWQSPIEYGNDPSVTGGNDKGLDMATEGRPPYDEPVSWETVTKHNLGFEINVLDDRLRSSIDLFSESREGLIMERRVIPVWYGNSFPFAGVGETKNHGVDIELNWNDNISSRIFYWVKANISLSENRQVAKDDSETIPDYKKQAGKPIGWNNGLTDLGLMQNWDEVYAAVPTGMITTYIPGDITYNDYNADGVIDDNDKVPIGNPSYATKSYALSFGASYKNFSLTVMFNGMFGLSKQISNNYLYAYETTASVGFMLKNNEQMDAWTPDNTDTDVPVLHSSPSNYYGERSTYNIRNSSFLRLRNVELKYTLPQEMVQGRTFLNNVEVFVNGNNLHTWQRIPKAFDPEAARLEVYPITKRYNAGLRLSF